jgi:GAF domain-containing protein
VEIFVSQDQLPESVRLKEQNRILWALAVSQRTKTADFITHVRELISAAADFLQVEKVSIWEFESLRETLECTQLYDSRAQAFSSGLVLNAADYPVYFAACSDARFIDVADVTQDARTAELLQGYLLPGGITAMLDVPIFMGARQQGIVCFEHSGGARHWTEEDRVFAIGIADLAGLAIADREQQESLSLIESGLESLPQAVLVCGAEGCLATAATTC